MTNASKKRRIRAYMAEHGVNYTTALRALEAQRPAADKPTSASKDD